VTLLDVLTDTITEIRTILEDIKSMRSDMDLIKKVLKIGIPVEEQIQFQGVTQGMPATMTDVQSVAVSGIAAVDAAGEAVKIDTTQITWTVGDPTLLTFTQDPTTKLPTFSFNKGVFTGTLPATSQVSGQDTVNNLTSQDSITVNTSAATTETIQFGTPTP
jgi:hypothetical protein